MKIVDKQVKDFEPFDVSIKVETLQDAIKLYSLFNHETVLNSFEIPQEFHESLREYLTLNCPKIEYEYDGFFKQAAIRLEL